MYLGLPRVFPSFTLLLVSSSTFFILLNASRFTLFVELIIVSKDGIVRYDIFTWFLFRIFLRFDPSGKLLSSALKKALPTDVSGVTSLVYTGLNQIIRQGFLPYHVSRYFWLASHDWMVGVRI